MKRRIKSLLALASACAVTLLSGCAASFSPVLSPSESSLGVIEGNVHGGQQPVSNAHIYVMQAAVTGYGAASTSLISTGFAGSDAVGNYMLTDGGGSFSITGSYMCTSGSEVYVLAEQGNPGLAAGTNNTAIALMAALGTCPSSGTLAGVISYVTINEVSTVVTAYALAGFATDATHISSSGTGLAAQGLANAFAAVPNMMTIANGVALTGTATPNSFGVVPRAEINTLANVLAVCVNSGGPTDPGCATLFADATANGISSGTKPTETATAAINMAHHPGQAPGNLFNLQAPIAPFQPSLTSAPNDLTLKIYYAGGGLNGTVSLAVDGYGNVWGVGNNTLTELSPLGVEMTGTSGITGSGLNYPTGVAIDASENVWVANFHGANLSKFSQSGNSLAGSTGFTGNGDLTPYGVAIDLNGNAWTTNKTKGTISKLNNSGSEILNSTDYGYLAGPEGIAVDASNNMWTTDPASNFMRVHSNATGLEVGGHDYSGCSNYNCASIALTAGSIPSAWMANGNADISFASPAYSGGNVAESTNGGLYQSSGLAIDGAGFVWVTNQNNSISEFTASYAVTGSTGYTGTIGHSSGISVDGSGNVWVSDNSTTGQVVEFVGAAAPVVTPLVQAAMNNKIAGKP